MNYYLNKIINTSKHKLLCFVNYFKQLIYSYYYCSPLRYNNTKVFAICCIAKCENDYIREFIEYHISIGFNKIYIYDNNDIDGERFEDVIQDYIKKNIVKIIDYRGRSQCQTIAYNDCYKKYNKDFDWILFIDCDEFFTTTTNNNVPELLNKKIYKYFQILHINWMVYDDNNLLDNDGRKVIERFTRPKTPFNYRKTNSWHTFPDNYHIKSLIRGNLKHINWLSAESPHTPKSLFYKCANLSGNKCEANSPFATLDYSIGYLRHYTTKTIGEYIKIKMKRGFPDQPIEKALKKLTLDAFFEINERTPEKESYIKQLTQEHEYKNSICTSK